VIPVAREIQKNAPELEKAWKRVTRALFGRTYLLAITGVSSAGKTVLHDYLSGNAYRDDYHPPGISGEAEHARRRVKKAKLDLVVVPGQKGARRWEALDQLFNRDRPPVGVVHVVSHGYVGPLLPAAEAELVEQGVTTVDRYRKVQLKNELRDFEKTCDEIGRSIRRTGSPQWIMIAVAKADLYWPEAVAAQRYYLTNARSPFVRILNSLRRDVGENNLEVSAAPVSAWLEDFVYNGSRIPSVLKPFERDYQVRTFATYLHDLSTQSRRGDA